MKHLELKYVKIHPKAIVPTKVSGNLAFDLHVVRDEHFYEHNEPGKQNDYRYRLMAGQRRTFHTGLKIAIPTGYGIVLRDRSGLAVKQGLHVLAGVIDSSYRGEYMICLINTGDNTYEIVEGDRIAQAIIVPEYKIDFIEEKKLDETFRGEKGFGASGR
jgi:dUTP pyrophosphatase